MSEWVQNTPRRDRGLGRTAGAWLALLLLATAVPRVASGQEGSTGDPGISEAEAEAVLAEALRERGLAPPSGGELEIGDYLRTNVSRSGWTRNVSFWVGPEGQLIPNEEWREAHPDHCGDQRWMTPAAQLVNFKLTRVPGGEYAFMQVVDVEARKIEGQRKGQGSGVGGLSAAVNDAWSQMGETYGPPQPCTEKIEEEAPPEEPRDTTTRGAFWFQTRDGAAAGSLGAIRKASLAVGKNRNPEGEGGNTAIYVEGHAALKGACFFTLRVVLENGDMLEYKAGSAGPITEGAFPVFASELEGVKRKLPPPGMVFVKHTHPHHRSPLRAHPALEELGVFYGRGGTVRFDHIDDEWVDLSFDVVAGQSGPPILSDSRIFYTLEGHLSLLAEPAGANLPALYQTPEAKAGIVGPCLDSEG